MKYKFLLVNKTADYNPNGHLGHLKMFVGDEQAVQQGSWTNLNGNHKVSFNFKVQDKVYQVIIETPTYWTGRAPRGIFEGNGDPNWMSDVKDPKDVWISVETDMPVTRFEYLNMFGKSDKYNDKLLLTETTTNTVIFDKDTPSGQTISIDVPMRLHHRNKNTFITFK